MELLGGSKVYLIKTLKMQKLASLCSPSVLQILHLCTHF